MGRKRVLEDKACEQCGDLFRPRLRVDKYCCADCRSAARSRPRKICLHCRSEFQPATGEQKYCSHACSSASQKVDRTAECQWCKQVFERPHGKARAYCSRSCSMKARNAGLAANYPGLTSKPPAGDGYHATSSGYRARKVDGIQVFEHREVMERIIGRPLMKGERVHHRNGKRDDNRPENLELWTGIGESKKDPHGVRLVDKVLDMIGALNKAEREQVARRLEELNA